jgi:hypothetical protein
MKTISQSKKDLIETYVTGGGWVGDMGYKIKNLIKLYENSELPEEALRHMLTEMMKMTRADSAPEEFLKKVEQNGVVEQILAELDAQ